MTSNQPQPMPAPEIKEVSWVSCGTEYHAIRLTGTRTQTVSLLETKLESLLKNGSKPTVIIASRSCISQIRSLFLARLVNGRLTLDFPSIPTVSFRVDHRITGGLIYILHEDMEPRAREAVEFEGLESLP